MIRLAYCNVKDLDLKKAYELLPDDRKNKVDRFKFVKDKKLSCGAFLLLKRLLLEENIRNPTFKFGKYEKAYLADYDDIYFNISHSKEYVACGISDEEIGVDIEYNDEAIDLNIAQNYFFSTEYEDIMNSKTPSDEFFNYWVLKESYMKYTGLGFNLNLDDFCILKGDEIKLRDDENNIEFSLFDIGEYKLACAGKYSVKECEEYCINDLY